MEMVVRMCTNASLSANIPQPRARKGGKISHMENDCLNDMGVHAGAWQSA